MLHEAKIGECYKCGADLCVKTNGADYESKAYWVNGDPFCLHVIKGCEFDLNNYTMRMFAKAAGFIKEVTK